MNVWIVPTLGISRSEVGRLQAYLCPEEKLRASKFIKNQDKTTFIVAHALKRKMLSIYTGCKDPKKLRFSRNKNGKPFLVGYELNFNLSHSHSVVACAVDEKSECGVDIENYRNIKQLALLSNKVLTQKEQESQLHAEDANKDFLDKWVIKEAVLKKSGEGLAGGLKNVCTVSLYDNDHKAIDKNRSVMADKHIYQYKSSDYTLAICTQSDCDIKLKESQSYLL
ncbi:MAG: 4'-phosphopantetheinyl transferase superfamily protein [Pseudomonadota bacterium]